MNNALWAYFKFSLYGGGLQFAGLVGLVGRLGLLGQVGLLGLLGLVGLVGRAVRDLRVGLTATRCAAGAQGIGAKILFLSQKKIGAESPTRSRQPVSGCRLRDAPKLLITN